MTHHDTSYIREAWLKHITVLDNPTYEVLTYHRTSVSNAGNLLSFLAMADPKEEQPCLSCSIIGCECSTTSMPVSSARHHYIFDTKSRISMDFIWFHRSTGIYRTYPEIFSPSTQRSRPQEDPESSGTPHVRLLSKPSTSEIIGAAKLTGNNDRDQQKYVAYCGMIPYLI